MEKFIQYVIFIVDNSTLEEKEKNKLLQFIEMGKKDIEDAQKSEKLYSRQKKCFYKAYYDCIKNACICYGIEDIHERILKLHESKLIIGEITNNKSDGIHLPNIYDKEYFENVALKYLKALPSNITYYDAKYNILKNMEMVEDYPLLKEALIHVNPVETIRTGLDLIGGKVALRYQITIADVLFQLHENDKNA